MTKKELLEGLDLLICWECAETRPVFAHEKCQRINETIDELAELLDLE